MRIILAVSLVLLASGCNNDDVLSHMSLSMGGKRNRQKDEKGCRGCGTELSKNGKCQNMTCEFTVVLQNELTKKEREADGRMKVAYDNLTNDERSQPIDKYRAKDMATRPWGTHWLCVGCGRPATGWIESVTVDGKEYKGPFMCCQECESHLATMVQYKMGDTRR